MESNQHIKESLIINLECRCTTTYKQLKIISRHIGIIVVLFIAASFQKTIKKITNASILLRKNWTDIKIIIFNRFYCDSSINIKDSFTN